jgi:TPR repeat protein
LVCPTRLWDDIRNRFNKMLKIFNWLIVCLFILSAIGRAQASVPSDDDIPAHPFDDRFSTNWFAMVQAALPAKYSENHQLDFEAATNGLAHELSTENVAAHALWGFTLIILSKSPEATDKGLKLLREAANQGYLPAMINLGYLFENGRFVRQNYNESIHWFSLAAAPGNAEAELQLGACYFYGLGVTPDYAMAAKYFRYSAEQTNYAAMKSLGFVLSQGQGAKTNYDEVRHWFLRAANEGGNRRAMYDLGALEYLKYPDTNAVAESFQWMKRSADLGDPQAAFQLSNYYFHGWGTETNLASHRYWLFKAAVLGQTEAQVFMGDAYRWGHGVPKDDETSLVWYGKAAAKNHPEALYDLAVRYFAEKTNRASMQLSGELMVRAAQLGHREAQFQCAMMCFRGDLNWSHDTGRDWLDKAAENGWARAEFCLFQLYYNGIAPGKDCPAYPQDKTEGVKWLRRAAEHGSIQAQSILAVMLIQGRDVDKNTTEAEKLLRDAAAHGYSQAENDLGFAILNGDIASTNLIEAAIWCKLARSDQSNTNAATRARVNLAHAMSRLTYDQQNDVDDGVKNFKPLPLPEDDPKIKDWQKNPAYQAEDGRFGH